MEAEARSITNRPDINAHLTKLKEDGVISEFVESGKRLFATRFSSSIDYSKYTKGATFVSLENSMSMQKEMLNQTISAFVDHCDSPTVWFEFKKYWPLVLYPCQNMTTYGVIFPKVPNFCCNVVDTRNIWTLAALLCRIETLWKVTTEVSLYTKKWHGWMLVYLTKQCFNWAKQY